MKKIIITVISSIAVITAVAFSDYLINNDFKIVKTGVIMKENVVKYIRTKGIAEEGNKREIIIEMPFSIKDIYVEEGDKVIKGQKLLELDKSLLRNKIELENLNSDSETVKNILAGIDNYKTSEASPINGVVTKINVKKNSVINVNLPVMVISDLDNLSIKAYVPENLINYIYPGQKVNVIGAGGIEEIKGYVHKIHPVAEKIKDNTIKNYITAEIKSDDYNNIKAGTNVTVEFEKENKKAAVVIPFDSVMFDEASPYVYINRYGYAVKRYVNLGEEYETDVEVLSGLNQDEKLILNPKVQKLKEGDKLSEID